MLGTDKIVNVFSEEHQEEVRELIYSFEMAGTLLGYMIGMIEIREDAVGFEFKNKGINKYFGFAIVSKDEKFGIGIFLEGARVRDQKAIDTEEKFIEHLKIALEEL